MALQHTSAPPRTSSPVRRPTTRTGSTSGVRHANTRHTARFTVVGNHLTQHRELSLLAIGVACHIQSLPAGAPVGIKSIAARFPDSEYRIAGALRELEAHGYLARTRERLPNGKIITRTTSYNQPEEAAPTPEPPPDPPPHPEPAEPPRTDPAPARVPEPPLPQPSPHPAATALLTTLHRADPRLLLSERDVHRLAPAATAWLDRGATPDAVRRTLTSSLPDHVTHPAALLSHRLATQLPPPVPPPPVIVRPDPLQTCEACDRAFRAPEPGHCRDCRTCGDMVA